jgi:hypothetical protein
MNRSGSSFMQCHYRRTLMALASHLPGAVLASLLALAAAAPAHADDRLVRFDGGIGSQPLRAGVVGGPVAQVNDVFGIPPGGRPWVIADLRADVRPGGRIRADGRGLLLGGGNGIGTPGGQSVRARLICGGVFHDSELVPLDANGDFRIDGALTPVPPSPCASPVLLVVNTGGAWFAAGIPKR